MGSAREAVFDQGETALAALGDHGQIAPIPAQGGGTVGLVAAEMTQGQDGTTAQITQLHGGSASSLRHGGQQSPVATQGRLLLGAFDFSAGNPLDPRRASREGQKRGGDVETGDNGQGSAANSANGPHRNERLFRR